MTREEAIKFAEYAQIMADGKPDVQEFYKLAESALRQQDHFRDLTKKVEPLTLEELRRMEGQPVYIVENTEYWAIVNSFDQAGVYLLSYGNPDDYGYFGLYGKTWLAYRQKPEEGTV